LETEKKEIEQRFSEARRKHELAQRTPFQKFQDVAVDWARGVKLLSPLVFPKLIVAGITRMVTNPIYRLAGAPLRLIPGLAEKAPNELGWSARAMADSFKAVATSGPQAWAKLTKGKSDIDVMAGKVAQSKEMSGLIGNAHGMVKEPVRQGAYARSIRLRTEQAIRNGLDPKEPAVQASIVSSSVADAFREIFMNDSMVTKYLVRVPIAALRSSDVHGARTLANTMEFLMPIVNVPTNIGIATARLNPVIGFGEAFTRLALAAKRGELENRAAKLSEEDAAIIARAFKAGMIGTVLAAYAWNNADKFGGEYGERKGKLPEGALKPGQYDLFGHHTPTWMGHAPEIQWLNIVASSRRVYDRYYKKGEGEVGNPTVEALAFSLMSPVKHFPFIDQWLRLFNEYESSGQILGKLTRDALIPTTGAMNAYESSRRTLDDWGWIPYNEPERRPKTFLQEWEYGIPGARQNVPEKKK